MRPRRAARRADNFITEATSLAAGDLVVHVDHGIGRFVGLQAITAAGAPHDCLEIHYADAAKLFLPVENVDLLSRYGSDQTNVDLDRLGSGNWQARKARMKSRIREIAGELIKIAAERQLREAPKLSVGPGAYDEFCAGFPYEETDDQLTAIDATLKDLASGRPMDRLVCGDVGFGKTEIALRAAFDAAINGKQVAVVVPTTLLARQHFKNFTERFRGFPINVAQLSRLVPAAEVTKTKAGLAAGTVDIVIGTHAVLGKAIKFKDLGLVVVDEEQHFGVSHKERLKTLRAEVHVLTLTATPIPRTLQLALTGVRDLSIIASPPVDRLAVRTFISPFDPLVVREALLREKYRGGQAFYVCPRIEDLAGAKDFLEKNIPEIRVIVAHGQMPPSVLDDIMTAFYDGKYDVLLSTTIVESGLDIPTANTLIVHRADMFGLAQLYQLRGRVGRAKLRAYALLTLPANKPITPQAERRLKVLQSLDTLGAGFQLASHDLDIRGAGNLLGEEQSGHIKEVGFELYQQMLEEAVVSAKAGLSEPVADRWSPQITIGTPILIPEDYVADLSVRLALYRRLADMEEERDIESFAAEMVDRFGPLPREVEHLLQIVAIKSLCRRANVEKLDAGPKGVVLSFRDNTFANPDGLFAFIREQGADARVRNEKSGQKLVFLDDWENAEERLKGTTAVVRRLAGIRGAGQGGLRTNKKEAASEAASFIQIRRRSAHASEVVVHARTHQTGVVFHVERRSGAVADGGELAEIDIEILKLGGPSRREHGLDTGAGRPAKLGGFAGKTAVGHLDIAVGNTAGDVRQPGAGGAERHSDPCARRAEPGILGFARRQTTGAANDAALDAGPRDIRFQADDEILHLVIVAELTAEHRTIRAHIGTQACRRRGPL